MIGEHGYEAVKDNLEKWLKETSELDAVMMSLWLWLM